MTPGCKTSLLSAKCKHTVDVAHVPGAFGAHQRDCLCRVGTEHEKLAILAGRRERATYEDLVPILRGLVERHGWDAKMQGDQIFGASVGTGSLMEPFGP